MLSQSLLNQILSSSDIYDHSNIYESDFYKNKGDFAKKDYIELKKGMVQYLKDNINKNIGKKSVEIIL